MKTRVIRDPIYSYIRVEPELGWIVDHPLYQRLRRVTQTSLTPSVYPSAVGSRFEHGLGAMYLAGRGWTAAWENCGEDTRRRFVAEARKTVSGLSQDVVDFGAELRPAVAGAALLHDVGHPPFSHALESHFRARALADAYEAEIDPAETGEWKRLYTRETTFHEFAGSRLAHQICDDVFNEQDKKQRHLKHALLAIVDARPDDDTWAGSLHSIIAGEVDVDRLDYLIRDSHRAGAEFGSIDYQRLVDALELHHSRVGSADRFRIAPGMRARSAVETLLVQRLQSYQWIHFHPRVIGFNLALGRAFELIETVADRYGDQSGRAPASSRLLRAFLPNDVYWDPGRVNIARALSIPNLDREDSATEDMQQTLDVTGLEEEANLVARLEANDERKIEIQACVDDASVVETLKRAYFLSRADVSTEGKVRDNLLRLGCYARAVLFRHKNFVSAWKTAEEYQEAAEAMAPTLMKRVRRIRKQAQGLTGESSSGVTLAAMTERLLQMLERDAVIGFNALVDAVLNAPDVRRFVVRRLNEPSGPDEGGFWDLAYAGYGLRKSPTDAIELFVGDEPVRLAKRSALARAVADAERSRVKLYVFYFFLSREFGADDSESASNHRSRLRRQVEERLPAILEDAIEQYVR